MSVGMIPGMAPEPMAELQEQELFEAVAGLGNWHKVKDREQYIYRQDECVEGLKDIMVFMRQDSAEPARGYQSHLKLGEWKVVATHLQPLFCSSREDPQVSPMVLKVLTELTSRIPVHPVDTLRHLEYLQDYKEVMVKKDVFIILIGMLVQSMEDEEDQEGAQQSAERNYSFQDVLFLLRNLISLPDPRPGDAGYTPMRQQLQLQYILHFHEQGVFDFFLLFGETLESDRNEKQAWAILEIIYHLITQVDPEGLMEQCKERKDKKKGILADLLEKDQINARLSRPVGSRHSRFGTVMQKRDATGGVTMVSSVYQQPFQVSKGKKMWQKDFKNRAGTEKKMNMFHDPFFVDLEAGAVKDHNQINPYVRVGLGFGEDLSQAVMEGLRKFFLDFVQTCFSSLVSFLLPTVLKEYRPSDGSIYLGRPRLLNFVSWILEFHRHVYFASVAKAKANKEPVPIIDIASIQGAIDVDMINFVTACLRKYGKEYVIHSSFLVLVLRTLSQQIKTIAVVLDSKDGETRDCGDILIQNIVKDDVMAHLCWIMKNFKPSSHDLRVLSYSVEVFHLMTKLMKKIAEKQGGKCVFHIERTAGARLLSKSTTADSEIESLADKNVVESLVHLLEKYKKLSDQLISMLVKMLYGIIRAQPTNIVVFFELSYFVRINRIVQDPLVRDKKQGKRYEEMVQLLRYILRQFFKCAEVNKCVFVELLFRKVLENAKEGLLLESHTAEFAAILDNYEDERYVAILDRMKAGETFDTMKKRNRQVQDGNLPWTEEEDEHLRTKYPTFADHPLVAELLAADLPEDSHRNAKQVKKRLQELGITGNRGKGAGRGAEFGNSGGGDSNAFDPEDMLPPAKKPKLDEDADARDAHDGGAEFPSQDGIDDLEMDLERLLDRAWDSLPQGNSGPAAAEGGTPTMPAASSSATASSGGPTMEPATQESMDLDLELEAMLDEEGIGADLSSALPTGASSDAGMGNATSQASGVSGSPPKADGHEEELPASLQCALEELIEEGEKEKEEAAHREAAGAAAPAATPSSAGSPIGASRGSAGLSQDDMQDTLEGDLEALLEEEADRSNMSSGNVRMGSPQAATPQADDAEADDAQQFWEAAVQEIATERNVGMSSANPRVTGPSATPGGSQVDTGSQEDTLELDLERIMDG